MDLMAIVNEMNRQYFFNTINIESIRIEGHPRSPPEFPGTAQYTGDEYSGSIVFNAGRYANLSEADIRYLVFHEMAHQLVDDHGKYFDIVMRQYTGPSDEDRKEFAQILKDNIERKASNGKLLKLDMLPPEIQAVLRKRVKDKKLDEVKDIFRILGGCTIFIFTPAILVVIILYLLGWK
jgi:hypothetical protein